MYQGVQCTGIQSSITSYTPGTIPLELPIAYLTPQSGYLGIFLELSVYTSIQGVSRVCLHRRVRQISQSTGKYRYTQQQVCRCILCLIPITLYTYTTYMHLYPTPWYYRRMESHTPDCRRGGQGTGTSSRVGWFLRILWFPLVPILQRLIPRGTTCTSLPQRSSTIPRVVVYIGIGSTGIGMYRQEYDRERKVGPLSSTQLPSTTILRSRYGSLPGVIQGILVVLVLLVRVVHPSIEGVVGVYLAYGVYQHHSIIPIPTGNPTIPLYLYQWVYSGQQEEQGRVWVQ